MEINLRGLSLQVRGRAQRHTLDPNIHTSTHDMLTTTEEPVHTKLAHAREPATMYTISARIKHLEYRYRSRAPSPRVMSTDARSATSIISARGRRCLHMTRSVAHASCRSTCSAAAPLLSYLHRLLRVAVLACQFRAYKGHYRLAARAPWRAHPPDHACARVCARPSCTARRCPAGRGRRPRAPGARRRRKSR